MRLVILALIACGLVLFASTQANERRRRGKPALTVSRKRLRRAVATVLLAVAFTMAVAAFGPAFGVIYWTLFAGLAGLLLAAGQGVAADRAGLRKKPARRHRAG